MFPSSSTRLFTAVQSFTLRVETRLAVAPAINLDFKEKMMEKLGIDMRKHMIMGACNPPNAYKAVLAEQNIGLMLPCNVIVYEKGSKTVLSVVRPTVAMQMIDNMELQKLARAVEGQLKKAFDAIK